MNIIPPFGQESGLRNAEYKAVTTDSFYLPMRDGVHLAVDLCLPQEVPQEVKLPAIMIEARYWRSFALRVAIAGHEKDTFTRIPEQETPIITVQRKSIHASSIELPLK